MTETGLKLDIKEKNHNKKSYLGKRCPKILICCYKFVLKFVNYSRQIKR